MVIDVAKRQQEIHRVHKLLMTRTDSSMLGTAEHLVDNDIGTKDRFEALKDPLEVIPIDYKE